MKFQIKSYEISSSKIRKCDMQLTAVLISDLHLAKFGDNNDLLLEAVRSCVPDIILIAGDMVNARPENSTEIAEKFVLSLVNIAPVYYANGNHEKRMKEKKNLFGNAYKNYVSRLKAAGVHYLENETDLFYVRDMSCRICGLDLPLSYFARFKKIHLEKEEVIARIGAVSAETYNILIAHHPRYAQTYFDWGADLVVSGHVHGGVARLGNQACLSPDGCFFPKYGYGLFQNNEQYLAVSAGLGEHSVPFRIMNPREIVKIVIKQEVSCGDSR